MINKQTDVIKQYPYVSFNIYGGYSFYKAAIGFFLLLANDYHNTHMHYA